MIQQPSPEGGPRSGERSDNPLYVSFENALTPCGIGLMPQPTQCLIDSSGERIGPITERGIQPHPGWNLRRILARVEPNVGEEMGSEQLVGRLIIWLLGRGPGANRQ